MYCEYVRERLGKEYVKMDEGFAIYSFMEDAVYLEEIYVRPELRKSGVATQIADYVAQVGRNQGKKYFVGTVNPSSGGATTSLRVLLGYKMELMPKLDQGLIWFYKEL